MARLEKTVKKAFIRYTKKHYPQEAKRIIERAEELFPEGKLVKDYFLGDQEAIAAKMNAVANQGKAQK